MWRSGRTTEEVRGERGSNPAESRGGLIPEQDSPFSSPDCLAGDPEVGPDSVRCRACGASYESLRGTPLFAPAGVPIGSRLLEIYYIYPYSEESGHGVDSSGWSDQSIS